MPYTPTNWVSGTTPVDAPEMNNLEKQYTEATLSWGPDLVGPGQITGFNPTKDVTTASQLDVSSGTAYLLQTDGTSRQRVYAGGNFSSSGHPSTTLYLDMNPDGTFSYGTSHSAVAGHQTICTVTTDASSNISTITDTRPISVTIFPTMTGGVSASGGIYSLNGLTFASFAGINAPITMQMSTSQLRGIVFPPAPGNSTSAAIDWYRDPVAHYALRIYRDGINGFASQELMHIDENGQLVASVNATNGTPLRAVLLGGNVGDVMSLEANVPFHFGIDGNNELYIYDVNKSAYVVQGASGTFDANSGRIPILASNGGGNAGRKIYVGTTDPGGNAGEGDIWVKA